MVIAHIDALINLLWAYHHLDHELRQADLLLVMGSHDVRVAERGAELFEQGYAPLLVFSGGHGRGPHTWERSEAGVFWEHVRSRDIPEENVILETHSTNTGDNVRFTKRLLAERGISPQRVLAVHKPYMERRAYATIRQVWPEVDARVTSPQLSYADYAAGDSLSREELISAMVGDLQRIKVYPARGYQISQEIPAEVWQAYEELVARGYTQHLLPGYDSAASAAR